MKYQYFLKNGEKISVFCNEHCQSPEDNYYGCMQWGGPVGIFSDIKKDENGEEFFIYKGEKIFKDDFIAMSPEKIVSTVNNGNVIFSDDLCMTLMKYGMDSLKVICSREALEKKSGKYEYEEVVCEFQDSKMFPISENYKVSLVPLNDSYFREVFYTHDLVGLLNTCREDYKLVVNKEKSA